LFAVFAINTQHSYMSIKALAEALQEMSNRLENGQLAPEDVGAMLAHAREMYERLVILHFKAFEEELEAQEAKHNPLAGQPEEAQNEPEPLPQSAAAKSAKPAPPMVEEPIHTDADSGQEVEMETDELPAEEGPSFRFGPPENAPNQISLIDSIEEIKRMEKSINDTFKDNDSKTLADKLKKTPIHDLKAAIGINMRFQFTSTLFENDADAYNQAVEQLNSCSSFLEADEYVQNTLKNQFDWQMKNPVVKQFIELVERRYL